MKEFKIVDKQYWEHMERSIGQAWERLEDKGWSVDQVIARPKTYIEYDYVLVREKPESGEAGGGK